MKWVVIHSNLAQCPEQPIIKEIETVGIDDLMEYLRINERNDMNITAVPLTKLLIDIGIIEECEKETVEHSP